MTGAIPSAVAGSGPDAEPAVRAVARVFPAVVNINTERTINRRVADPFDALFYEFFGYQRPAREIRQRVQSLGSGFLIDPSGFIVTNEHVVERAADLQIRVTLSDGTDLPAVYVAGNPDLDLALIKIQCDTPLPYLPLDDLSPNLLGQTVLALGNPLGYGSSVTRGILSARERSVSVGRMEFQNLLQTDVAINPGNSGGPLVDLDGRLVGISSVKLAYTPEGIPAQGIGFAIPADVVRDEVRQLREVPAPRALPRPLADRHFGMQLQDLTPDLAAVMNLPNLGGALVSDVEPDSPSARAGLRRGHVIVQVGQYETSGPDATARIEALLERIDAGSRVEFALATYVASPGNQIQIATRSVTLTAR